MGEMKKIYNMVQDGSYTEFIKIYHNTLADEENVFVFQHRLYTVEQAEAIALLVQDTIKDL
tara:strand:- start:2531 stop:2713 length:183 start_codon:yes stop_codon:yes gene_type:complete